MNVETKKEMVRLFVAAFPSEPITEALDKLLKDWRGEFGNRAIRWTLAEQMHVTLAFIGSVEWERVADFETAMEEVAQGSHKCNLESIGTGCFPNARTPRVLWAGLQGELEVFSRLQKGLETRLKICGYVPESRAFHPHLTLGRVNQFSSRDYQVFERFLKSHESSRFGKWQVDRIQLMRSVLGPAGSKYSVIKTCNLSH